MEKASQVIQDHPQISHAYERGHHYNLWFTLAAHDEADIETEMGKIAGAISAQTAFQLPGFCSGNLCDRCIIVGFYRSGWHVGNQRPTAIESPGLQFRSIRKGNR